MKSSFSTLEEYILAEYGTLPLKIGVALLRKNTLTFDEIKNSTELDDISIRDGLSFLIQRRVVSVY